MATQNDFLRYRDMGFSVIPIFPKAKNPLIPWTEFQSRIASDEEIDSWCQQWPDCNIAIVCGQVSGGIYVLDVDPRNGGAESITKLTLPNTVTFRTGSGGDHFLFRDGAEHRGTTSFLPGLDFQGDGKYIVAPGSTHPCGGRYYEVPGLRPGEVDYAPIPRQILEYLARRSGAGENGHSRVSEILENPSTVGEGERNDSLARLAGRYAAKGLLESETGEICLMFNRKFVQPLPDREVLSVVGSIYKTHARNNPAPKPKSLEDVKRAFNALLKLEDPYIVDLFLATLIINRWDIEPMWMMLVAPPSSAKTEIIRSAYGLDDVFPISSMTDKTLTSSYKTKDGAEVALLPKMSGKTLLFKDFTTMLELHPTMRSAIFSQFREIYDGSFDPSNGLSGRRQWRGKIGFLAGVTDAIDAYHSFSTELGERFLFYKMRIGDRIQAADKSLGMYDSKNALRDAIAEAVKDFMAARPRRQNKEIVCSREIHGRIISIADLLAKFRCPIRRNGYTREIEAIPRPEGVARIANQLFSICRGLCEVRDKDEVTEDEVRVAIDVCLSSIPLKRVRILRYLFETSDSGVKTTAEVAKAVRFPTSTTKVILEDMSVIGIIEQSIDRNSDKESSPYKWRLPSGLCSDIILAGFFNTENELFILGA